MLKPLLELKDVCKVFPGGIVANDSVSLSIDRGEVMALVGENGAGKTTLMNIAYGLYQPDSGEIYIDGQRVTLRSPRDAISLGIGMVHQHFMLIPSFSVMENIVLGREPRKAGLYFDRRRAEEIVRDAIQRYGFDIAPDLTVDKASVGMQQKVEIIKTLTRGARLIILDEPTGALAPREVKELFAVIRRLKEEGRSIVFISHKLREVLEIADRIAVMRSGQIVGVLRASEASMEEIAGMMTGRSSPSSTPQGIPILETETGILSCGELSPSLCLDDTSRRWERPRINLRGEPLLEVVDVHAASARGTVALRGVSFTLHAGEILGVAGVEGNGQTELAEVLTGLRGVTRGIVKVRGRVMKDFSPLLFREMKVCHIPEDRQRRGLVMDFTVEENLFLTQGGQGPGVKSSFLKLGTRSSEAMRLMLEFDVRPPTPRMVVRKFSGGNQQKVIIARELYSDPSILIAAHPTRGLDIATTAFVHDMLIRERSRGKGIVLISYELDELLALSDRIMVLFEGRVVDVLDGCEATAEVVGMRILGLT